MFTIKYFPSELKPSNNSRNINGLQQLLVNQNDDREK